MAYKYFAYVPIGDEVKNTTCLLRYKNGMFERYDKGKWIESGEFFSIFIGENDDFEEISEDDAKMLIEKRAY